MIRVLHVVSSLSTGSGVMSVLMNYYRKIEKNKVQFSFLSFGYKEQNYEEEIKRLGGDVFYCSRPSMSGKFYVEIENFFKEHQGEYQILHCHPIFSSVIFASIAKRNGIHKIIQHSHTTQTSSFWIKSVRNHALLLLGKRHITNYVACSEDAKKIFWWKKAEDVYFLPNAIDLKRFEFKAEDREIIRNKLNIKKEDIVIGHIGRFQREKNHDFLVNSFAKFEEKNSNAKLLLVGDGELMEKIRALIHQLNLSDKVILVGRQQNVPAFLAAMDIFVLPSIFEGLGIVLVEAQASGLKCLASTDVPQEVAITDNIVFEELSAGYSKWAERMNDLAEEANNRNHVAIERKDYDIDRRVKKLEHYYEELLR